MQARDHVVSCGVGVILISAVWGVLVCEWSLLFMCSSCCASRSLWSLSWASGALARSRACRLDSRMLISYDHCTILWYAT